MNRLVLIGNGFDLAHDLKTSYADFIHWYWQQRIEKLANEGAQTSDDGLCSFEMKVRAVWGHLLSFTHKETKAEDAIRYMEDQGWCSIHKHPLLDRITTSIETKGWVDIENEFYKLLKEYALDDTMNEEAKIKLLKSLNDQLDYLKGLLIQYLKEITDQKPPIIPSIKHAIYAPFERDDMSVNADCHMFEEEQWEWDDRYDRKKELPLILEKYGYNVSACMEHVEAWCKKGSASYPVAFLLPKEVMLLNFNYTHTAQIYCKTYNSFEEVHIHGDIDDSASVIFGYGDELHSDFDKLKEREDNECLRNVKSIRYLEATNYKKVLRFIESAPFQVLIMGHSCGRSDRTLLHTIFEHGNCASIKLCYYRKEDGSDDYLEKIQNISRNFVSMERMRDVVVPKPQCKPLVRDIIEVG